MENLIRHQQSMIVETTQAISSSLFSKVEMTKSYIAYHYECENSDEANQNICY